MGKNIVRRVLAFIRDFVRLEQAWPHRAAVCARPRRRGDRTRRRDVRLWHLADMPDVPPNVRFREYSGHRANQLECLLLTPSGHRSAIRASLNSAREPRARQ
jgi:hypothetical protein